MSRKQITTANVGDDGEALRLVRYTNASEEQHRFLKLKAELTRAYAAPDTAYQLLTADDIIRRNVTETAGERRVELNAALLNIAPFAAKDIRQINELATHYLTGLGFQSSR